MSDTVKLIIEIPKETKQIFDKAESNEFGVIGKAIQNGILLDSNDSDYAEAQAYFAGQAYGWEQGRKALIDEVKAEIKYMEDCMIDCEVFVSEEEVLDIIDKHIGAKANE